MVGEHVSPYFRQQCAPVRANVARSRLVIMTRLRIVPATGSVTHRARRGFVVRVRDARKQASRARVLEAARVLFDEVGFQETTVRMIAERAGLSPGGVFTTFDDKVAILCQILAEQREQLFQEAERLRPTLTGSTRERIEALMAVAHAYEAPRTRMVVAYIGASYGWSRKLEEEHRLRHSGLARALRSLLVEGVERGDVRADADIDILIDLISAAYLRNFRTAHYAALDAEELDAHFSRQLDLLFTGAAAR